MDSIEVQASEKKKLEEKLCKQKENQEWIVQLIKSLEREFGRESEIFSMLEEKVFSHWGRYHDWQKNLKKSDWQEDTKVYFLRTFSYAHTDIQRMKGTLPQAILERVWKVIEQVYEDYETSTGNHIMLLEIR